MKASQKCQYAIRAVFELALKMGKGPMKVASIARNQAIPHSFLEVILNQLKHGGFVDSRQGCEGGYFLVRAPNSLTVGEVIYFIDGPIAIIDCALDKPAKKCSLYGDCVFLPMWEKVREAAKNVLDSTTFQNLIDTAQRDYHNYSI